jgi:hypothetical protein
VTFLSTEKCKHSEQKVTNATVGATRRAHLANVPTVGCTCIVGGLFGAAMCHSLDPHEFHVTDFVQNPMQLLSLSFAKSVVKRDFGADRNLCCLHEDHMMSNDAAG